MFASVPSRTVTRGGGGCDVPPIAAKPSMTAADLIDKLISGNLYARISNATTSAFDDFDTRFNWTSHLPVHVQETLNEPADFVAELLAPITFSTNAMWWSYIIFTALVLPCAILLHRFQQASALTFLVSMLVVMLLSWVHSRVWGFTVVDHLLPALLIYSQAPWPSCALAFLVQMIVVRAVTLLMVHVWPRHRHHFEYLSKEVLDPHEPNSDEYAWPDGVGRASR